MKSKIIDMIVDNRILKSERRKKKTLQSRPSFRFYGLQNEVRYVQFKRTTLNWIRCANWNRTGNGDGEGRETIYFGWFCDKDKRTSKQSSMVIDVAESRLIPLSANCTQHCRTYFLCLCSMKFLSNRKIINQRCLAFSVDTNRKTHFQGLSTSLSLARLNTDNGGRVHFEIMKWTAEHTHTHNHIGVWQVCQIEISK